MIDLDGDPQLNDFSSRIKFSDVAKRLEKIRNAKTPSDKSDKFKRLINSIRDFREKFISEKGDDAKASLYPILRLILPTKDTERGAYHIQTKTLGIIYCKALAINKNSSAGRKLAGENVAASEDFGDVVFDVMKNRQTEGTLTVYDVNKCLDEMSTKRKDIDTNLAHAIRRMSALDCKWFTRIILKKLGLRLGFHHVMHIFHPKSMDYYNQYSLLSRTCEIIESGNANEEENQNQNHIEIFKPIRPMLCERGKIADINGLLGEDDYYVETKMDGERCHIHIKGKEYKYFSRSCNDESTKVFGADFSGGLLSPVLHRLLSGKFESAIFDGEMMVWNREQKNYVTKTEKATARFLHADNPDRNPCYCIYDLLYLDGQSLMGIPYAERIRKLQSLVTESPGQLNLCSRVKIRDAEHFLECVNKAFDEREEGVVIKGADSIYQPGKREGGGWLKIKPDYENNLIVDFDLLIIGGYYNEKRTAISSFLLGVYKKDNDSENGKFYAVTTVHHGLSVQQRKGIQKKLEPYWQTVRSGKIAPSAAGRDYIEWNKAVPDVWIEPKNSSILQIKASDLVETNTFRTSHTFRFPRVMAVRDDKPWSECCSLNEFEKFCSKKYQLNLKGDKLTKRHATIDDIAENNESKQLTKKKKYNEPIVTANNEVDLIDNVCDGLKFCILYAGKYQPDELKAMILKHGGQVVANPGPSTYACIAASQKPLKVEKVISSEKYNIATVEWLRNSFGGNTPLKSLPKFQPLEMIYATPVLEIEFKNYYDIHGDSYSDKISKDDFKAFVSKINVELLPTYTKSELYELETNLWTPHQPPTIFRFLTAQFLPGQKNAVSNLSYELAQFVFRTKAGRILNAPDGNSEFWSKLTHIFINENDFDPAQIESWKQNEDAKHIKIVSHKWILECSEANKKISDERFIYNRS